MGVGVSSSHVVSAPPSSSEGGVLALCPHSSTRSLSRETVLHKLLQLESFPRAAALHELPQHVSLPMGCSPSGIGCSSVVTSPVSKPASAWAPLSTGLQVLAGACSSAGSSAGSQLPSGINLLWCGVPSTGYRWISAPLWTSMGCRGTTCLTMVFSMSCKGRLCAPASGAPPRRPASLTLVSVELFRFPTVFFPLLKYVIPEALPPLLMGSALASGRYHLRAGWHWVYQTWGKLLAASHSSHLYSPHPLPKPCHATSQHLLNKLLNIVYVFLFCLQS